MSRKQTSHQDLEPAPRPDCVSPAGSVGVDCPPTPGPATDSSDKPPASITLPSGEVVVLPPPSYKPLPMGLNLSKISRETGLGLSYLSRIFSHNPATSRQPRVDTLTRLATYFGCDIAEVVRIIDQVKRSRIEEVLHPTPPPVPNPRKKPPLKTRLNTIRIRR